MPNKPTADVPERPTREAQDARVQRTERALSAALVELMITKGFEAITVQEVLDRAGVGRSTFYSHFRNKDDLLLSDTERFASMLETHFESTAGNSPRVAPIAELFSHVGAYAAFAQALQQSGRAEAVYEIILGQFAKLIKRRLDILIPTTEPGALPREMASRIFAAAAIELLKWWVAHNNEPSAAEMDQRFHQMVWCGIRGPESR